MNQDFKKHTIILTGKEINSLMQCLIITQNRLGGMSYPIPPDIRKDIDGNDIQDLWFKLNRKLKKEVPEFLGNIRDKGEENNAKS